MLKQFELILAALPPRLRARKIVASSGMGKIKHKIEKEEFFWIESTIRPHFADNLAKGFRWYHRFDQLLRDADTRDKIQYEKKGLQIMADSRMLTEEDEAKVIAAVHRAIYQGRGKIYAETMGQEKAKQKLPANDATKNRWKRFMEKLRLGLVGAKNQSQVQSVINELLARHGWVKELRDDQSVHLIRKIVFGTDWQRARNLALFALASYKRPASVEAITGDDDE